MTLAETQAYYDELTIPQAKRFNLLVSVALKLGKPIEGAYSYAHTIMEKENGKSTSDSETSN